jgi:acyl-CoA synthetase (AMP-forming)/AMP-acid ligase II
VTAEPAETRGPRTVPELLRRNSARYAAKPVIVTDDDRLTHAELDDRSSALARRLVAAGVGKSSRIGLMAPNGIGWAVTAAAVMRVGAVLVPLSTLLRPPELLANLETASVTHLIAVRHYRGRAYLDEIEGIAPGAASAGPGGRRSPVLPLLRHVWPADGIPEQAAGTDLVRAVEDAVRPADDLVILFTSGSSGRPKGVIHTQGSALRAVASGLEARCVTPEERLYAPMPFFWTGGFGAGLLTTLLAGATLLTEETPEPARTLRFLQRERATLFRGWPDQAAALAAHPDFAATDLSSLGPGSLAAVLPDALRPAPGARASLYGMTETCGPSFGARLDVDLPADEWGSCGRPFAGIEVRITDPDTAQPSPAGEPGEVRLRGPNVMRGICGRTKDEVFDRDGYYRTGDLGALDADGYLWYRGRLDDMFKVKGATVFPSEVEAALRSIDGVRLAYVTNVPAGGVNRVGAALVAERALDEIAAESRARLSSFKVPTVWFVTTDDTDVPMLASSKVDRSGLQEMLRSRGTPEARR